MAVHVFSTRDELLNFWSRGRGFLLNKFKNCLHQTRCATYRGNPPGLTYTRQGFDTPTDVLHTLGREGRGWYSCPTCRPHHSIGASQARVAAVREVDDESLLGADHMPYVASSERHRGQRAKRPVELGRLSESARTEAVDDFNKVFGEMDRVLWCLSRHCRAPLREGEATAVVEGLVWTVKSWWGVQGVRTESKKLIARSLASMDWPNELFVESLLPPREASAFAFDVVNEVVRRSMALGVERREFSLASKIAHWLLPWRIPVYDSFVRESLGIPSGRDHTEAYRELSLRIFEAAHELEPRDVAWLGRIEPRTPLRGFDKCLWWLGGGSTGNAVVVRDPWRIVRQLGLEPC